MATTTVSETITNPIGLEARLVQSKGFDPANSAGERPRHPSNTIQRVKASEGAAKIIKAAQDDGGVIIEGFVSQEKIARLNAELDPYLAAMDTGCPEDDANEIVKAFHGIKSKRLTNLTTRSRVWREEVFDYDLVHEVNELFFGPESGGYWQSTAQVIELGPGAPRQMLHRDGGNMPHFWKMGTDGLEVVNNFLVALTDTTVENGATLCVPGSHKWSMFDHADGDYSLTVPATLKAGDALFISGKMLHAGGENKTDKARRVISWNWCPCYVIPEEAHCMLVPLDIVKTLSERSQRSLGFRSQRPKGAAGLWMSDMNELGKELGL